MQDTFLSLVLKGMLGIDDIHAFWKIRERILRGENSKILLYTCKFIRRRYGCGIPVSANIQPFDTPHGFYGIFISHGAVIGRGCTVFQQVTIGSNVFSGGVPLSLAIM